MVITEWTANIVAATNLAAEMPTGTETGIQHGAFLRRHVYLDLTSSTPNESTQPIWGAIPGEGCCSSSKEEDNTMLTFYGVPFRRNISFIRESSRMTNLPSRRIKKSVLRPSRLLFTMLLEASEEVCHDGA